MESLDDFLKRLKEDPTRTLQAEFENFLADFHKESTGKADLQSFLHESEETQKKIIDTFLSKAVRRDPKQPFALDTSIYEIPLDDFLQRVEFGDTGGKNEFEKFLSSWTDQEKNASSFEEFLELQRGEQESLFQRFQEEELPETQAKDTDAFNVQYDATTGTQSYTADDTWLQKDLGREPEKDESGYKGSLAEIAAEAAEMPDRFTEKDEEEKEKTYQ